MPDGRQQSIQEFWTWFKDHRSDFEHQSPNDSNSANELTKQLSRVDEALIWELHPAAQAKPFVLALGAEGDTDLFDTVLDMVEEAPSIPGWRFQAFRQPDGLTGTMRYKGAVIGVGDVKFTTAPAGDKLYVNYFVRGWRSDRSEDVEGAVILLVDGLIGEFDSVAKIENVSFADLESAPREARPIVDLPKAIAAVEGSVRFAVWRERMIRLNRR